MKIRNHDELRATGSATSRAMVLDIVEDALARVDSYDRIRSIMSLDGDLLRIGHREWDLRTKRNVYLIGAGKACNAMAMAVDHVLGDRLTRGIAIVKIAEDSDRFHRTEVHVGGHPIPDGRGHAAALRVLDLVDASGPDDLFIAVISGGSSALMNVPVDGISVRDEAIATELLLTSGAGIAEINAVRRHISQVNGGRLAERIRARGAELIGIAISDAVGRPGTEDIAEPDPGYHGTPIGPDRTTFADARATIRDYELADRLPRSVRDFLATAGPEAETPAATSGCTYFLVNSLPDLAAAAEDAARAKGLRVHVLTTGLTGESRDAGAFLAAIAAEVNATGRPFAAPCVIVCGGETVTWIREHDRITGRGGPSQELALGFALAASGIPGAALYAMDSEGTDGTSPAAGALVDSTTADRARVLGVDLRAHLRGHSSYEALSKVGDAVRTGNTGTNLCDLNVLYVPGSPR
ncbi:glycerate kinase type-2 family protein [Dactylosporangium sp. CA-233914]|uniref:glycerate kinase type-2 family protein n=1 Tax=Dactylosporangium sp. CA-233914 TaxID=3239934 RepID=UPI003D8F632B